MSNLLASRAQRLFQYASLGGTSSPASAPRGSAEYRGGNNVTLDRTQGEAPAGLDTDNPLSRTTVAQDGTPSSSMSPKRKRSILMAIVAILFVSVMIVLISLRKSGANPILKPSSSLTSSDEKSAHPLQSDLASRFLLSASSAEALSSSDMWPPDVQGDKVKVESTTTTKVKDRVEWKDFLTGRFYPAASFNGTWISGTKILYADSSRGLAVLDVAAGKAMMPKQLMSTFMALAINPLSWEVSPDGRYLLMARTQHSEFRRSQRGRYSVLQLKPDGSGPGSTLVELRRPPNRSDNSSDQLEAYQLRLVKWAPAGNALAYVDYRNNLYVRRSVVSVDEQLTDDGSLDQIYNGIPDWVFEEEVLEDNAAIWWSPDGTKLAFGSYDDTDVDLYFLPEYNDWNHIQQYPRLKELRYPKVNRTNPRSTLWLVRNLGPDDGGVGGPPVQKLRVRPPVSMADQEVHFSTVTWADNDTFAVAWFNRVQNETVMTLCSASESGDLDLDCSSASHELFVQRVPDGYVNHKYPVVFNPSPANPNPLLRDFVTVLSAPFVKHRYRQLVHVSGRSSRTYLTQDEAEVQDILGWTRSGFIYYTASLPGQPRARHLFKVVSPTASSPELRARFGQPVCVTCDSSGWEPARKLGREPCNFFSAEMSSDLSHYVLSCKGPDVPWSCVHRVGEEPHYQDDFVLMWNDNAQLASRASRKALPQVRHLSVPVADSDQEVKVKLFLPPDLDPSSGVKYPLIIHTYGGPDTQYVTDEWGHGQIQTYLAGAAGFVYAEVDGKGTGMQGDDWRFLTYRTLGSQDVSSVLESTAYLQKNLSFVDPQRTAIWGWSYGGYMAVSALSRDKADTFKCGVAVAPVTDWTLYDTYYTERLMGLLPENKDNYDKSSVFNSIDNLKAKRLFMLHGTHDDNVHLQQSLLLAAALESKAILFRQQLYPDQDHSIADYYQHLMLTIADYFKHECFEPISYE